MSKSYQRRRLKVGDTPKISHLMCKEDVRIMSLLCPMTPSLTPKLGSEVRGECMDIRENPLSTAKCIVVNEELFNQVNDHFT